jgi:D-xylose transport system permease protein
MSTPSPAQPPVTSEPIFTEPVTPATPAIRSAGAMRNLSMAIALVAICGFFAIADPAFLSPRNLSNLTVELSITAVLSLGMLLVIVLGHIDLSIGSGVGLFGGIIAVLIFEHNWPAPAAMAVATVIAVIVWLAMGALIVRQRIPAFIITLAGLMVFRGLHWSTIGSATIPIRVGDASNMASLLTTWFVPPMASLALIALIWLAVAWSMLRSRQRRIRFQLSVDSMQMTITKLILWSQGLLLFVLICNQYRGIPLSAVILGVVAWAIWLITNHLRFGRYVYAIGGNEEAALISGVPVNRVVIGAFGIMGFLVALGGFMQTAYAGASTTTIGALLELDAIAACVIGGTSLKGGRGTVLGVIFGSLIMASLLNGMTLMAISPEIKYIARGTVLALAVWMDVKFGGGKG